MYLQIQLLLTKTKKAKKLKTNLCDSSHNNVLYPPAL